LLKVAIQRLIPPAPDAFRALASVPLFVENPGDPDSQVKA